MRARGLKHPKVYCDHQQRQVAPHAGAWIETMTIRILSIAGIVAPHAGAWIETFNSDAEHNHGSVAPHAGAWIETPKSILRSSAKTVAPHAGAWIETWPEHHNCSDQTSRPMRARGLKHSSSCIVLSWH